MVISDLYSSPLLSCAMINDDALVEGKVSAIILVNIGIGIVYREGEIQMIVGDA